MKSSVGFLKLFPFPLEFIQNQSGYKVQLVTKKFHLEGRWEKDTERSSFVVAVYVENKESNLIQPL